MCGCEDNINVTKYVLSFTVHFLSLLHLSWIHMLALAKFLKVNINTSICSRFTSTRSVLIFYFHLCLYLPNGSFASVVQNYNFFCAFMLWYVLHPQSLRITDLMPFDKIHKLWRSSLCNFLRFLGTLLPLGTNIPFRTLT